MKFVLTIRVSVGYTYCVLTNVLLDIRIVKFVLTNVSFGYTYCEVCPYKRVSVGYTYCEVCPYKCFCWLYVL